MVKRPRPPQWHLLFTGIGLLAAVIVGVYVGGDAPTGEEPTRLHNLRPSSRIHTDAGSFADITDEDQAFRAIGAVTDQWKTLDILLNNAGMAVIAWR